jgi:hypothetical protein
VAWEDFEQQITKDHWFDLPAIIFTRSPDRHELVLRIGPNPIMLLCYLRWASTASAPLVAEGCLPQRALHDFEHLRAG